MGMHPCKTCMESGVFDSPDHIYSATSTGDIDLIFPNGHWYRFPDMILHYIRDHKWLPPKNFIDDVLAFEVEVVRTERMQTKGLESPFEAIGYLTDAFVTGEVPDEFMRKLIKLCELAAKDYPWAVAPKAERKEMLK